MLSLQYQSIGLASWFAAHSDFNLFRSALPTSAHFHPACSLVIAVNSGFVGSARAALHVIDEGSQFRHHLMAAGIIEKHARRRWGEWLQDVYEFSRFRRSSSDRPRHLRKTHTFDGRAKDGGKV